MYIAAAMYADHIYTLCEGLLCVAYLLVSIMNLDSDNRNLNNG